MKLELRLSGWRSSPGLQRLVRKQVGRMQDVLRISRAHVVLEHHRDATPAWTARAHLEVPGPDLRAAARDHTVLAAWRKVVAELDSQVARRIDHRRQHADERRRIRPLARAT